MRYALSVTGASMRSVSAVAAMVVTSLLLSAMMDR